MAEQLLISVVHALGASFLLTQELSVDEESAREEQLAGTHLSSRIILLPGTKLEGVP